MGDHSCLAGGPVSLTFGGLFHLIDGLLFLVLSLQVPQSKGILVVYLTLSFLRVAVRRRWMRLRKHQWLLILSPLPALPSPGGIPILSLFLHQHHLNLVPTWLAAGGTGQAQSNLLMTLLTDGLSRGQRPSFKSTTSGQLDWSLQGPQPFWNEGSYRSLLTVTSLGRWEVASCPHYYFWDNYQCV